ncbi:ABC transporter ATP-binding protein [Gordonia humi]
MESTRRSGTGVDVAGLTRVFGDGTGLKPVDLTLSPGEFVSVLGPSGCGKSTFLRCLAGLEQPDAGRIAFGDHVVYDGAHKIDVAVRKRGLGMVFQDLALWPHLDVAGNVAFPLKVAGVGKTQILQRVTAMLDRVDLGLYSDKAPHQLSGGQQQRVAIARALVAHPDLLLLDEPFSALDVALRGRLRVQLRELTTQLRVTSVFVTHDQTEAMSMSDRVIVMNAGRIAQIDAPRGPVPPTRRSVRRRIPRRRQRPARRRSRPAGGSARGRVRGGRRPDRRRRPLDVRRRRLRDHLPRDRSRAAVAGPHPRRLCERRDDSAARRRPRPDPRRRGSGRPRPPLRRTSLRPITRSAIRAALDREGHHS